MWSWEMDHVITATGKHLRSQHKAYTLRYDEYFSCSLCLKLRPRRSFADKQIRKKRGRGRSESSRRFCVECGVQKRIYQQCQRIDIEGHTHFLCGLCNKLRGSGFYCIPCGACQPCFEKGGWPSLRVSPYSPDFPRPAPAEDRCPRCACFYIRL